MQNNHTATPAQTNRNGGDTGSAETSIESTTMPQDEVVNGTTTFVDTTNVQLQKYNASYVSTLLLPIRDQTISDFMRKPQLIASGHWLSSQVAALVLQTMPISNYLSIPVWANKIEGFGLVRGTAVVRIVINANPFQQGKLLLTFDPLSEQGASTKVRYICRSPMTQCPNVEVDCRDAAAVMEVPYISPTEFFVRNPDFDEPTFGWGVMRLAVLAPLLVGSGGDNSVDYSIYLHFEDFELAAPIMPQSGYSGPKGGSKPSRSKTVTSRTEATVAAEGGPLSGALMSASKVAGALAGVPSVSMLAAPASWMLRGASGVASWFGWSKPLDDKAPIKVSRLNLGGMANSTGVSGASNLGLYHDTSLQVLDNMAGNDCDEMSFNYLKGRKAFVTSFEWNTSDEQGHRVFQSAIGPAYMYEEIDIGGSNLVRYYPPFAYIGRFFTLWRGAITLTFKFVKTDFHSGRIVVMFVPGSIGAEPTLTDSSTVLREVIDVRGQSEFTMTFPYLLAQPYREESALSGAVYIRVLNELKAPATVAQSITCLVYASAGDDYEVAVPGTEDPAHLVLIPQVGGVDASADQVLVDEVVGGYSVGPVNMVPSSQCIGECFTSVKQLLTKYTPLVTKTAITSTTAGVGMYPYVIQNAFYDSGANEVFQPPLINDALSIFGPGFVLYRGRIKILDSPDFSPATDVPPLEMAISTVETSGTAGVYPLLQTDADYVQFLSAVLDISVTNLGDVYNTQLNGRQIFDPINGGEASIPYYCKTRMSLVWANPYNNYVDRQADTPRPFLRVQRKTNVGYLSHKFFRACADDFQLAYFIGFPPLWSAKGV